MERFWVQWEWYQTGWRAGWSAVVGGVVTVVLGQALLLVTVWFEPCGMLFVLRRPEN